MAAPVLWAVAALLALLAIWVWRSRAGFRGLEDFVQHSRAYFAATPSPSYATFRRQVSHSDPVRYRDALALWRAGRLNAEVLASREGF